jgi:hypothetical protein
MAAQDILIAMVVAAFVVFGLTLFGVSAWLRLK